MDDSDCSQRINSAVFQWDAERAVSLIADGAGLVDANTAQQLANSNNRQDASDSTYEGDGFDTGYLDFSNDCPKKDANNWGWCKPKYEIAGNDSDTPIRIVFSFNSEATCSDADYWECSDDHLTADLDLKIIEKSTGDVVTSSGSYDNSNEFVQFVPDAGEDYYVKFIRWDTTSLDTYYAIAWDTRTFYCNDD